MNNGIMIVGRKERKILLGTLMLGAVLIFNVFLLGLGEILYGIGLIVSMAILADTLQLFSTYDMKDNSLRSFRNAQYWLLLYTVIGGAVLFVPAYWYYVRQYKMEMKAFDDVEANE